MATIGAFTKTHDGSYTGAIRTLSLNVKGAQFRPNEESDDKAPDYRIFAGGIEFGAAWKKTSRSERDDLSVRLGAWQNGNRCHGHRKSQSRCGAAGAMNGSGPERVWMKPDNAEDRSAGD